MNKYLAFYNKQKTVIEAATSYEAQRKAQSFFKTKKGWMISIVLAEKDGVAVKFTPDF